MTPRAPRIGVRELRSNLSRLIGRASSGERIVVTVAGRPVAQIGPIEADSDGPTLEDLAARGQIRLARREDRPPPTFSMPMWAGTRLDHLVREVRGR